MEDRSDASPTKGTHASKVKEKVNRNAKQNTQKAKETTNRNDTNKPLPCEHTRHTDGIDEERDKPN